MPFVGNAGQFKQVFWNLVKNALKAMPDGGRIDVGVHATNGRIFIEIEELSGPLPFDEVLDELVPILPQSPMNVPIGEEEAVPGRCSVLSNGWGDDEASWEQSLAVDLLAAVRSGDEEVQPAVAVVIRHAQAHAGLFLPVLTGFGGSVSGHHSFTSFPPNVSTSSAIPLKPR